MRKRKVVAYARYSSNKQRDESIHRQIAAIEEYCGSNNLELVNKFIDEAQTGTSDKRDEFQQMIAEAEESDWDYIVVYKLDRLSRNVADAMHYRKQLAKLGIRILSVIEDFDESTPEGGFFNLITMGISEFYVKNLAREAFAGLMQNAEKAMATGGTPPLGYDIDKDKKYIVNEHEAEAVRMIFNMVLDGYSYVTIVRKLNAQGYKTKRGTEFKTHIHHYLVNRKYIGEYTYNLRSRNNEAGVKKNLNWKNESEVVRIPGGIPVIIEAEIFDEVQRLLQKRKKLNKRRGPKSKYLLTGLIKCSDCGSAICGNTEHGGRNKHVRVVYRCNNRYKKGCKTLPMNATYLDRYITELLSSKLHKKNLGKLVKEMNLKLNELESTMKETLAANELELLENERKISSLASGLGSSSKGIDKLIYSQINEVVIRNKDITNQNKDFYKDLENISKLTISKIEDSAKELRDNLKNFPKRSNAIQKLIQLIKLDKEHVKLVVEYNELLPYNLINELKEEKIINRDIIAYNRF